MTPASLAPSSRRRVLRFLLGVPLAIHGLGSAPALVASDAKAGPEWDAIVKKAHGGEVRWAMWGGSDNINAWVDKFVAKRMKELHGITVKRVPIKDTVDVVNKVVAEKQAGKDKGSVDLVWINGENFKLAKDAGILYGPFTDKTPNFKAHYDAASPDIAFDFGTPVDGYQAPYGKAQFVFVYDSAKVKNPPKSFAQLKDWVKANPGRFTYPAPPDFTGSAFVRQAMYATTGGHAQYLPRVDLDLLRRNLPKTWSYLSDLRPHLWLKGETYPESKARMDQLYADGEVWMTMGYSPATAEADMRKGVFPKTTRTFVMDEGTLANTHFTAIPYNAPNKEGAMVLADFLMSPEAQLNKLNPSVWGDIPALDPKTLSEADRKAMAAVDMGPSTLPVTELASHRVPEIQPAYLVEIEQQWTKEIAAKKSASATGATVKK